MGGLYISVEAGVVGEILSATCIYGGLLMSWSKLQKRPSLTVSGLEYLFIMVSREIGDEQAKENARADFYGTGMLYRN